MTNANGNITSIPPSTSIFGDQSIVAQWKAGTCANGDGQIVLARAR